MKTFLTSAAAACLILFAGASAQGELLNVTTLYVPGAIDTEAYGIDGGNIVGYYKDGSYNYHGFSYDGTTYTTLDVPGASNTEAYGIDGGNIVGYYYDGSYHGFSYDGTTYTTLDVPGASNTEAYGIDGGNIVGYSYVGSEGSYSGFLAVIPEPATLSLLAVGMLMACRRRR
jgi:hypothetical protein